MRVDIFHKAVEIVPFQVMGVVAGVSSLLTTMLVMSMPKTVVLVVMFILAVVVTLSISSVSKKVQKQLNDS